MRHIAVLLFVSAALAGCASVKFLDKDGANEGFLYYPPKPYLVIEQQKEGPPKVSVLTLPDLEHPKRVQHKSGWGTFEFGFELTNGVLTKFNSKADTKGPELLGAIAQLGTAKAAQMTAEAALLAARAAIDESQPMESFVDGKRTSPIPSVISATAVLQDRVLPALAGFKSPLKEIRSAIELLSDRISQLGHVQYSVPDEPAGGFGDLVERLAEVREKVSRAIVDLRDQRALLQGVAVDNGVDPKDRAAARDAIQGMDRAIVLLSEFTSKPAEVLMYEVKATGGGLRFERVQFQQ